RCERRIETRRGHDSHRVESAVATDHDGGATWQRFADRLIGLAAEHDRLAHGQAAKMRHVRFQPPRQRIAAADDAVLGDGSDDNNVHRYTATAALMCGCGS